MKKLMVGLMAALMMVAAVAQPVFAASTAQRPDQMNPDQMKSYGFSCDDGVCRLRLDLGVGTDNLVPEGIWLEVMQETLRQAPGGVGVVMDDAVTLTMPSGQLQLVDAELFAVLDDAGAVTNLYGTAMLPLPTLGLFGDLAVVTPTRVEFGYDLGAQVAAHLAGTDAPLDPARRYLYFTADAGLRVLTQQEPGVAVSAAPGQHVTVVADLVHPMLWFDGVVTVRTDGEMAFLREIIEPIEGMGWVPDALPLRQTVTWGVQGQIGLDVAPQLVVDATTQMDVGIAGTWLALDAVPLVAHGRAMLTPAGLLVSGSASTDLSSRQFFGADALAQVFVPFTPATAMTAEASAGVQVPFMGIDRAMSTHIAGDPQEVIALTQGAWQSMQAGTAEVGDMAVFGWDWAAMQSESGYRQVVEQADRGWTFAQSRWCDVTGTCADAAVDAERMATAAAAAE